MALNNRPFLSKKKLVANGQWLKAKKSFVFLRFLEKISRLLSLVFRLFRIFAQKIITYGYSTTKTKGEYRRVHIVSMAD
jgi:hypothetical protein